MSELARNIASRLRHLIGDRRRAERCKANLAVEVLLLEEPHNHTLRRGQSTRGHTVDISATGLAVVVPVIRIGEHYLAGENRSLLLDVELPSATVEIQVTPVRYERLDETESEHGYLIGVSIDSMNDEDRIRYDEFVTDLLHQKKLAGDKRG
jgi:c-di-GMP-binding flagellar brake protein YcgR